MRPVVLIFLTACLIAAAATGSVLTLFTSPVFEILEFHPVALDYMYGRIAPADMRAFSEFGATFTEAEISHLDDVRVLLAWLSRVFLASVVVCVLAVWMAPRALGRSGLAALIVLALSAALVAAAYALFGFEMVGTAFHEIVFPQGNWLFPYQSLIIQLYGTDVMVAGAAFVIALGVGSLAVLTGILWITGRLLGSGRGS